MTEEQRFEDALVLDYGVYHDVPIWVAVVVARACHEVNRSYCAISGDAHIKVWEEAPEWQKTSAVKGIFGVLKGNNPEQSHESWLAEKKLTGWKYGPVKNEETKEHPCFVPYSELPEAQKVKDKLYVQTARALLEAYGHKF